MGFISRLGNSLLVMVIGLLIVFTGLIILIACIKIMSIVVGKMSANKAAKEKANAPAPVVVPEPVVEAAAEESGEDEEELIAVITAALMAYSKSNGNKTLVVRNIRRANAWAAAGRADQLTRF